MRINGLYLDFDAVIATGSNNAWRIIMTTSSKEVFPRNERLKLVKNISLKA